MIVWLASYPRSGNTLLRTLLKSTMDLDHFSDEGAQAGRTLNAGGRERIGKRSLPKPWEEFYREASSVPELSLVKTHRPPRDAQPAIYVVRDGRFSVLSYLRFHQTFFPDAKRSLPELIVGDDVYGDWSSHVRSWQNRAAGPLLFVRFEELINASTELVRRIAEFIGYRGQVIPWTNPRAELQTENPQFIGEGATEWRPPGFWTDEMNDLFFALHGDLMRELGYENAPSCHSFPAEIALLGRKMAAEKWLLQRTADERQRIIDQQLAIAPR